MILWGRLSCEPRMPLSLSGEQTLSVPHVASIFLPDRSFGGVASALFDAVDRQVEFVAFHVY